MDKPAGIAQDFCLRSPLIFFDFQDVPEQRSLRVIGYVRSITSSFNSTATMRSRSSDLLKSAKPILRPSPMMGDS